MMPSPQLQTGSPTPSVPLTHPIYSITASDHSWGRIAYICPDEDDKCSRRTFYNIWLWSGCGPVFLITAGSYLCDGKGMHYWLSPRQDRDSLGLAWTHRWILPTSEKTLANWPFSEQLGLTLSLPALMLSKDRSRHRL